LIDLLTKQDVILKGEVEGLSQRSVAIKLVISRNTVKKYIQEYRNAREKFTDLLVENFALTEAILEKPSYNTEKLIKRKLTDGRRK
jgi:predicted transcriptional regulator